MSSIAGQPVRVSVNGQELNVRVDGPEGAPWMVFSNSLTANTALWDEQAVVFASRYRVLRYDQRGHGNSGAPLSAFGMDDLAGDLLGLLEHYSINNAILVGVSMGTTTVMRCAARALSRCKAVVACDGQWRSAAGSAAVWEERFVVAREQGMAGLAEPTARRWFQPEFFVRKPAMVEKIKEMVAGTSIEGYFGCAKALQDYDFSADYPGITVPVQFVVGAQDGDLPSVMKEMHMATPGSRYAVIDHCGHLPNIEQPEEFFAVMDTFIRQLG